MGNPTYREFINPLKQYKCFVNTRSGVFKLG